MKSKKDKIDNPDMITYKHVNTIIKTGIYPKSLEIAYITSIFKSHDKKKHKISCLLPLNQIIKKLLYTRKISFINKNNILYDNQLRFQASYSILDAIKITT